MNRALVLGIAVFLAIVGISLDVIRVEAKRKLSQNKDSGDLDGAIAGLRSEDRHGAAAAPHAAVVAAAVDS